MAFSTCLGVVISRATVLLCGAGHTLGVCIVCVYTTFEVLVLEDSPVFVPEINTLLEGEIFTRAGGEVLLWVVVVSMGVGELLI